MTQPRAAFVAIGLAALLLVIYLAGVIRLTDLSPRGTRHTVPGELVVVQLSGVWDWLRSSDPSVVAPLSVALKPQTRGYFVAARPGRAWLNAFVDPCPVTMVFRCMAPAEIWVVEVDVWPASG